MKHARQISLQDRLSAMFRVLPGVAATALVFSLVFFSPLIDMKDTIAAAAQSHVERAERRAERQAERAERRSERAERRAERQSERAERQAEKRSERAEQRSERSERGGKSGGSSNASQPNTSASISTSNTPEKDINNKSGTSKKSGASAPEKPASSSLINRIFGEPRFAGDSEPSGGALSKQQEREAIQSGWK